MQWQTLLDAGRLHDAGYVGGHTRSVFVQDHDRIVFSAPFRRLANKTQVHPLYDHDHIHHRLIHSVEVASVGRSLAMRIGHWLIETGAIAAGEEHSLANVVQAACAAHDIGNPPYGHSGEAAIGGWFADHFAQGGLPGDLDPVLRPEFTAFEGNAQGFRILTRLEMYRNAGGMRLSHAVLGAFMKYPVTAAARLRLSEGDRKSYAGLKKFGLFAAEEALFAEVADATGLPACGDDQTGRWWRRHPLVLVVEAADDICYNIVDLEDAFTTGDLPYDVVREALDELAGRPNRDIARLTRVEHVALLRSLAIGAAINACVEAFQTHYEAIMAGSFAGSLIGVSARSAEFAGIERLAHERIFTARRKTELEVSGRQVIRNVLDGVLPVYEDLARHGWQPDALPEPSAHIARALSLDLREVSDAAGALHAMADFVSGMTDRYALSVSRMLSGT
jgi:dGTPase